MVSCYAPQAGRSQIEKEEFWRQVEGVIMNTDINQEVIVGGDMNGHVGEVAKEGRQNIFRIAKQKKKERKDITGTKYLKGDNGELLVSEEQVSGRWREYFEKLLNEESKWNDELSAEYVEGLADMISKEEVRQAIQDLKVRKAAGTSGVTVK